MPKLHLHAHTHTYTHLSCYWPASQRSLWQHILRCCCPWLIEAEWKDCMAMLLRGGMGMCGRAIGCVGGWLSDGWVGTEEMKCSNAQRLGQEMHVPTCAYQCTITFSSTGVERHAHQCGHGSTHTRVSETARTPGWA